jgi:hypothetical protein
MALKVEDLEDQTRFSQIHTVPFSDLINFVLEYIGRKTGLMFFFWSVCIILLGLAITLRINIAGYFPAREIFMHTFLGLLILPLAIVPVHEILHIISFLLTGARRIRVGIDLRQYIFYVTAHRHVSGPCQFRFVALIPFIIISAGLLILIYIMPGLWKWSLSLLLFVHTTMCAGDFALLNFYHINKKKKIYTWDDADNKVTYFYEEIR